MHFQIIQPQGILRQFVKYYWIMESDPGDGDVSERVIPTENVQIMFHYKNPFKVHASDNSIHWQSQSFISGLSNTYCDVSTQGETGVIAVTFRPLGACHFFKFPISEIEERNINLRDIFAAEMQDVEEQLYGIPSAKEKIACVETFLMRRFALIPAYDYRLLESGIRLIKADSLHVNPNLLSDKLFMTNKTLERKFAKYIGKTPKQFIKLIRFQHILSELQHTSYNNLSVFAYENGYYDQAHFIRDFKTYAGLTPKAFYRKYCALSTDDHCHYNEVE